MKNVYSLLSGRISTMLAVAVCSLAINIVVSKPAAPRPIIYTQPDGTEVAVIKKGDENAHKIYNLEGDELQLTEEGWLVKVAKVIAPLNMDNTESGEGTDEIIPPKKYIFDGTPFPSEGEPHAIVVLVEFKDYTFTMKDPKGFYTNMLNGSFFAEYGATGSARKYFIDNSNGIFKPKFDVYGPVQLSQEARYYGNNDSYGNDMRAHEVCIEACDALDAEVDFSQYDLNDDGYIDNVYFIYAGYGEADSMYRFTIWPHSANLETFELGKSYVYDGKILDRYGMSNELDYSFGRPDGIGTFVHEFSHVLGLPDLYSTVYNGAFTPGEFSCLDIGSYNNRGRTPPHYSAFERYSLGWLTPEEFTATGDYRLETVNTSNSAYIIKNPDTDSEFYIFENRQKEAWDTYIPGHGMLVWHINFNQLAWNDNIVNNNVNYQRVDIIEADNMKSSSNYDGDTFPGASGVTQFDFETSPSLQFLGGLKTNFALSEIAESEEGLITFHVEADFSGISDVIAETAANSKAIFSVANGCIVNSGDTETEIFNISGAKVANVSAGSQSHQLPAGIYMVRNAAGTSAKLLIP